MEILRNIQTRRGAAFRQPSILLCLLFDFIGYASYSIPVLGEFADITTPAGQLKFEVLEIGLANVPL